MVYNKLDTIVKGFLLAKGYSLHWYIDVLKYMADCLRDISFHTIQNINTTVIQIDEDGRAKLPCDYIDYVIIGRIIDQLVRPLVERGTMSNIENPEINKGLILEQSTRSLYDFDYRYYNTYGFGAGQERDSFKVLKKDKVIQFDISLANTEFYIEYISDGSHCDTLTNIDPRLITPLQSYSDWKLKQHNRTYNNQDKMIARDLFYVDLNNARKQINSISLEQIRRIVHRNYKQTIKT
ncbi:hypothetical protein [Polluticaenibacter yanchengensis]|uniref:Uncharacterized protein n=1 Tax=Polluticaenibacter yanchengensis TaxID=3014562 RepID=A0ABT4UIQ8_9BACT|nr:hypothetical protein [Chitinophagaceae bacterium LY-5]